MKHLYFSRHGLSEMNVQGLWSGSSNTPLTPMGREQASKAGKLAREQGLVFDIILSSPLDRAHDTAKLIAQEIGYPHERIVLHDKLVERHFGEIEGKMFDIDFKEYVQDPFLLDYIPGIERITDLQLRANQVLEMLMTLEHDSVLVVSHGAFGRALRRSIENMTIHDNVPPFDNAVIHKLI